MTHPSQGFHIYLLFFAFKVFNEIHLSFKVCLPCSMGQTATFEVSRLHLALVLGPYERFAHKIYVAKGIFD